MTLKITKKDLPEKIKIKEVNELLTQTAGKYKKPLTREELKNIIKKSDDSTISKARKNPSYSFSKNELEKYIKAMQENSDVVLGRSGTEKFRSMLRGKRDENKTEKLTSSTNSKSSGPGLFKRILKPKIQKNTPYYLARARQQDSQNNLPSQNPNQIPTAPTPIQKPIKLQPLSGKVQELLNRK